MRTFSLAIFVLASLGTTPAHADQWCSVDTTLHTGLIGFDDGRGTQTLISVEMTPIQTYPPQGFGPTYTLWTIKSTGVQLSGGFYSAKYSPTQSPRAIYKIGRVTCSTPFGDGGLTDFSCVLNQVLTPCSIN